MLCMISSRSPPAYELTMSMRLSDDPPGLPDPLNAPAQYSSNRFFGDHHSFNFPSNSNSTPYINNTCRNTGYSLPTPSFYWKSPFRQQFNSQSHLLFHRLSYGKHLESPLAQGNLQNATLDLKEINFSPEDCWGIPVIPDYKNIQIFSQYIH